MERALKACIYHRASTRDQNPTLARGDLRRAAVCRALQVVMEVEETGSGARNSRPGLQQLMAAARQRRMGGVLVWKLDRFGRGAAVEEEWQRLTDNCTWEHTIREGDQPPIQDCGRGA